MGPGAGRSDALGGRSRAQRTTFPDRPPSSPGRGKAWDPHDRILGFEVLVSNSERVAERSGRTSNVSCSSYRSWVLLPHGPSETALGRKQRKPVACSSARRGALDPRVGGRKGGPRVQPRGTVRVGLSVRESRSVHAPASIHDGRLADGVAHLKAGFHFAGFFPGKGGEK